MYILSAFYLADLLDIFVRLIFMSTFLIQLVYDVFMLYIVVLVDIITCRVVLKDFS